MTLAIFPLQPGAMKSLVTTPPQMFVQVYEEKDTDDLDTGILTRQAGIIGMSTS
jgi:hypothetical protein